MDKKKKWDLPHWVMPGVFSGNYVVDEAVERISIVKPTDKGLVPANDTPAETRIEIAAEQTSLPQTEQPIEIILTQKESVLRDQVEKLELEITAVKEQLASWEIRFKALEEAQTKELQYLYQVVLALKKEWENERNEDRHH